MLGKVREPSVKTLRSLRSAQFLGHCVETELRDQKPCFCLLRNVSEEMEIIRFYQIGPETTVMLLQY